MKARKRSKLALASFILGIGTFVLPQTLGPFILSLFQLDEGTSFDMHIYVGIFSTFLLGLAAVITGIIALHFVKKYRLSGDWMAWVGIIIGALPVISIGYLLILLQFVQ